MARVIKGATVEIQNPVSRYDKSVQTDAQGNFEFNNIPYNPYHVSAVAPGFQSAEQDANVRSAIALEVKFTLKIGTSTESVTVTGDSRRCYRQVRDRCSDLMTPCGRPDARATF